MTKQDESPDMDKVDELEENLGRRGERRGQEQHTFSTGSVAPVIVRMPFDPPHSTATFHLHHEDTLQEADKGNKSMYFIGNNGNSTAGAFKLLQF